MDNMQTMYCKVYVDSETDKGHLLGLIASIVGGTTKIRTISSPDLQIDLVVSEDFDETRRSHGQDQFLFYRYYLDIEPTDTTTQERYVQSVGNLLEGVWRSGCKAVASCDFENELPKRGSYNPSSAI